uniref:Uncharacterized protein n=1 Tax=Rhizophora mucronata TaxID=61149 RepID=A0A2P2NGG9_RHIMU
MLHYQEHAPQVPFSDKAQVPCGHNHELLILLSLHCNITYPFEAIDQTADFPTRGTHILSTCQSEKYPQSDSV